MKFVNMKMLYKDLETLEGQKYISKIAAQRNNICKIYK